jgi:hypothetical protein
MIVAGILVVASAAIVVGLILTILAYLVFFPTQPVFVVPLVLLVPGLAWLGHLAYGLFRGNRWSRVGVTATMPILIPLYGLFIALLAPITLYVFAEPGLSLSSSFLRNNPIFVVRFVALALLIAGLLPSVVTPLLLIGGDVTTYLRRPRTRQ